MLRTGTAYMFCFIVSLIVGHAVMILLSAFAEPAYGFLVAAGEAIDNIFHIAYTNKEIAAFALSTLIAFPLGILFQVLFNAKRW